MRAPTGGVINYRLAAFNDRGSWCCQIVQKLSTKLCKTEKLKNIL